MKKQLIAGLVSVSAVASGLAQGTVVFENSGSSGGFIFVSDGHGGFVTAPPGNYTLALLWAPGSSTGVAQSSFTSLGTFGLVVTSSGMDFFSDPTTFTTGPATAGGTVAVFEVQGWSGSYANYAAAMSAGAYVGQAAQFLNNTGNPKPPATPPINTTGWDGNILLVLAPEPGTLALCGLGAGGLWLFRRQKNQNQNIK